MVNVIFTIMWKAIKKVLCFLWAVWGSFWFMAIIAIPTPVYALILAIFGKKYSLKLVWINFSILAPLANAVMGIRIKVFGKENVDWSKSYVIVANHRAQIDITTGAASCPQPARFLAKWEIRKIPIFGYMTRMLAIMVDRKSKESREKSYRYMIETLKKGESLMIYPEGTRNRTDQPLKEFKDGAFKVAILAQVPVAVQTLVNTRELNDPRSIHLCPGTVTVYWGKPIETKGMTMEDMPRLKEMVRQEMLAHLPN